MQLHVLGPRKKRARFCQMIGCMTPINRAWQIACSRVRIWHLHIWSCLLRYCLLNLHAKSVNMAVHLGQAAVVMLIICASHDFTVKLVDFDHQARIDLWNRVQK